MLCIPQMFSQYNIYSLSPSSTYSKRVLQHDTALFVNGALKVKTFTAADNIQLGDVRYNGNTTFPDTVSEFAG